MPTPPTSNKFIDSISFSSTIDSWQASQDVEAVVPTTIAEDAEPSDTEEQARRPGQEEREGSKTDYREVVTSEALEETEDAGIMDEMDDQPVVPPPPPPVPNMATRPVSFAVSPSPALPVDPAVPAEPIPVPPRPVGAAVVSPARPPPPPPPRLVPQPDEPEEEESESEPSYVSSHRASPPSQEPTDDENDEPLRRFPPRSVSNEETTEDDPPPLPVPNRRSSEIDHYSSHTVSGRPTRSIPPPPTLSASISDLEQDSDSEALPTRPRHRPMTPGTPPTNEIPLIVPPPASDDSFRTVEPSPLRHASYPASEQTVLVTPTTESGEVSPSHLSPTLSLSEQEVLDEEEGDPIDPSFHSPSHRTSTIIVPPTSPPPTSPPPTSPPPVSPPPPAEPSAEAEEDQEAARRRTLAERMAKLGGIKFGAAPLPVSMRATSPPTRERPAAEVGEEQVAEPSEEEEERARKERIAAKLAGMGGMRIGMMPLGVGAIRPQPSHVLTEETPSALPPAPPSRAVPATRPRPPPRSQESDAEPDSSLSASQHSLATSDEGVKVEAEESEIEEVSHADAEQPEEEPEEIPPPVPVRGPRRRGTGSETEHRSMSPPARPPVPTVLPNRKSSAQTATSPVRKSSVGSNRSVQRASYKPQSEYVMVEEPSGYVPEDEVPPPLPPSRPSGRPPARGVPAPPVPSSQPIPPSDSISSQWELPSIPSTSFEFGGTTDLSLSWPEDSHPALSSLSSPPPPPPIEKSPPQQSAPVQERPRSSDELIAVWGRVGVQVCEVATTLFEKSKKSLVGDGTYEGFVNAVLSEVPNVAMPSSPASYGYLVYVQTATAVQKRLSEIMPGDVMVLQDAKLKGHKGLQSYQQTVEHLVGVVSEFEPKKSKVRVFQANQHVGQQTVEAVSYRLEDLKSGTVKVYRVLES
ncbi:putative SH3 domain-containing protein [Lyophyllum shimeji]|uniref:SH3 domain-containing protein n=1 Tax=Lyophyllum shimeji TaxID=47721 RepID=A0A9P3PNS6_LYOSH|nr:putative SH3 domain-containing protein [Lyophyllum shimeji]